MGLSSPTPLLIQFFMSAICQDTLEVSIWLSDVASLLWEASVYCSKALVLLTKGSKRCRSPHRHHLTPSQRILATVTLLPHYLRQRSTKLPFSITLFINQMADTSMDNTGHVNAHSIVSLAGANDAGNLLVTAGRGDVSVLHWIFMPFASRG